MRCLLLLLLLLLLLFLLLLLQVLCLRLPSASGLEDEMVVAFRGTETGGDGAGSDLLTDIFALQVHDAGAAAA